VKIRGYRVEPGEVTALLRADSRVHDAAVVAAASESAHDELELVAYVVARPGAPPDVNEQLRARIARVLPSHMVPAASVAPAARPAPANGRLDRRALPRPARGGPDAAAQPPQTPVEQRCARIWEEVLGVPGVGLGDDFFALGGHSLKAVRVLFRV